MFIGTQYYRPPNPPGKDWERDIKQIKETGLEVIRTWIYWSKANPKDGVYVWEDYDRFFELAEKNGLKVLAQLMLDAPPYWYQTKYPEALYVDKHGHKVGFFARPAQAVGGSPGLCFDNLAARKSAEDFIEKTVKRYLDNISLYAWDVWNEIWRFQPCCCAATEKKFQNWLQEKYQTIDNLNQKWQRSYEGFEEIEIPKNGQHESGQYADMVDLYEFNQWSAADNMQWRVKKVKEADKSHLIVSHHGSCSVERKILKPFGGLLTESRALVHDDWLLAKPLDKWGISCYETDYYKISFKFNSIRSSAQGKPWWLSEHTGGRTGYYLGNSLKTDVELKSMLLLAFGHGAEGAIYWQWRPERFGEEAPNYGLTTQTGEFTSRTETVKQVCAMINRYRGLLDNLSLPKPRIGIMWEPKSYIIEYISYWRKGEDGIGAQNLYGYYKALLEENFNPEILNARQIVEKGIPKNIKVIFDPYQIINRDGLSKRVKQWVSEGGVLVAGPLYGVYGADTYASEQVPPEEIGDLFGVRQKEVYYPESPIIELLRGGAINNIRALKGHHLVESYHCVGSEPVGIWEREVTLTRNKYGRGVSFMVGSFLGNSYLNEEGKELRNLLSQICATADIYPEINTTGSVFARTAWSGDNLIAFLYNSEANSEISWITIPHCKENRKVIDLLSEEEIGCIGPKSPLALNIAGRDSLILLIK